MGWSWDEWRTRAARFGGGLRRLGVQPGERVACVLANSPESCAAVLGCWVAGACVVSLPTIARGMSAERYLGQLRRIIAQAQPALVLVDGSWAGALAEWCPGARVRAIGSVDGAALRDEYVPADEDAVFVQYSSGSTSDPSGCVLSARAIARQLGLLERALELDPQRDVKVDWLPLSHDMGLFGCLLLTAYWTGVPQVIGTPQRFLTAPWSWFSDCAQFGATLSSVPNFALELTAKVAGLLPQDPVPMRRLVIGGERVDHRTLERACAALGPGRLAWKALLPAYGLAEAVLAVTMTPLGAGPGLLEVDREALAAGSVRSIDRSSAPEGSSVTTLVSAGMALPGVCVETVGNADVGEVRVRSQSIADGYLNAPERTRQRFTSCGLLTGDLGFVHRGELYVTGRNDDLLIIAGRNVYARDIETALFESGAARPGNAAVVHIGGDPERLAAVVEPVEEQADLRAIAERIGSIARAAVGVRLTECVFLPRGSLPKTPSGKVQRFRCQELAEEPPSQAARIAL